MLTDLRLAIRPLIRNPRFIAIAALILAGCCFGRGARAAQLTTTDFAFVSQGLTLSGIISQPEHGEAKALVVFVHGYGNTDVRGRNMYADLRERFAALGIASATWDKPGQGRSEGKFDINQPVTSSAQEVLDAVAWLRTNHVPGAERIGIWGISRAGWIAPLALSRDPAITFWISVSGVTAEDNTFYLLRSNLPYEGSTVEEAETIMQEWKRGLAILRDGGSYEDYCAATTHLRANAYVARTTGETFTRERYEREQTQFRNASVPPPFELETGMYIFVPHFDAMLAGLDIPVLALFGEKDLNVDWRKTRAFYESTLGKNPAGLTIRTFADGNHNIDVAETGSLREMQSLHHARKSAGYYEAQIEWLKAHVLNDMPSERKK